MNLDFLLLMNINFLQLSFVPLWKAKNPHFFKANLSLIHTTKGPRLTTLPSAPHSSTPGRSDREHDVLFPTLTLQY